MAAFHRKQLELRHVLGLGPSERQLLRAWGSSRQGIAALGRRWFRPLHAGRMSFDERFHLSCAGASTSQYQASSRR